MSLISMQPHLGLQVWNVPPSLNLLAERVKVDAQF